MITQATITQAMITKTIALAHAIATSTMALALQGSSSQTY